MSLGWRLGLTTAFVVMMVMGILTLSTRLREIQRGREDRDLLLQESLVSLASELERVTSLEDIEKKLSEFHNAYADRGYPDQEVLLRDLQGRIIASTGSNPQETDPSWTLQASLPVSSSFLPQGRGVLAIRQEAPTFRKETQERWLFSLIDVLVTALCILLSLLLADYYLVARPLRHLLEGIRQMEMGYWGGLQVPRGAREIRWLAYRFQRLGGELEETMRRLVDAERQALIHFSEKAKQDPQGAASVIEEDHIVSGTPSNPQGENPAADGFGLEEDLLLQYLSDKCRLLESGDPFVPAMKMSAEEAWERDVMVAERLGATHLKSRLEDASLRNLNPEGFNALEHSLTAMVAGRREWLRGLDEEIRATLTIRRVPFREIQNRVKNVGSIWRKVQKKGLRVEQLHDIFAFRIIVAEKHDCYRVLEAIHHQFEPQLLRFKDYISTPKPSGYQSIHTCVRSREGFVFEVQIRTQEMHQRAEWGTAAHWRYKSNPKSALCETNGSARGCKRLLSGLRKVLHLEDETRCTKDSVNRSGPFFAASRRDRTRI